MESRELARGVVAFCVAAILMMAHVARAQDHATFFIAPSGDDLNPGTREAPFATLERARDAVRALKQSTGLPVDGATVYLRGGSYSLLTPLQLGAEDSGEADRLVSWVAYPGEEPRLSGGVALDPAWFEPLAVDDPARTRFVDPAAADAVRVVELPNYGITDYGTLMRRGFSVWGAISALELFVDAEPMELARWPNRGQTDAFDPTASAVVSGDIFGDGTTFSYLGTSASGNADDGYPNYHGQVAATDYYLYHCTWTWGGGEHRYWFISTADPQTSANCWPSGITSWLHSGTTPIPPLDPLGGAATTVVSAMNRPVDFAEHGFVRLPSFADDQCFDLPGDRYTKWDASADPWFQGLFGNYWADDSLAGTVNVNGQVCLDTEPSYGITLRQPFFVFNLLEEIDEPGEFFLDRTTGRLYLWPPADFASSEVAVSLAETPLLDLDGAAHLRFEGLVFELGRDELVTADGVIDVVFSGCTLRNCGSGAMVVRGSASGLERSEISNPGEYGVLLEGGSRPSLTASEDFVRDSEIHHFGRWGRTYRPAVRMAGCGHTITHNSFHDSPHAAILFTGNEHNIAYNLMERVVLEANDAGAIYTGRDWGYRGNLIQYNFIHHVDSVFGGAHGVYLDDASSGITVFGNLLVDINGRATVNGGGRDNLFDNNVMVRCFNGGHSADRRAQAAANNTYYGSQPSSWNLLGRLNVVYESYQYLSPIAYQSPPWSTAYPSLAAIPNDWAQVESSHWLDPEGSVFKRNISFDSGPLMTEGTWGGSGAFDWYAEVTPNLEEVDPLFVDEAAGDYTLRPDSPAFTMSGFVSIPFAQIGILPPADIFHDSFETGTADAW